MKIPQKPADMKNPPIPNKPAYTLPKKSAYKKVTTAPPETPAHIAYSHQPAISARSLDHLTHR